MFTIYGGYTEFNQWDLSQRVTEPRLSVGDKVVFLNSSGACYPMKAYLRGNEIVADVPNALLTMTSPMLVYINGHDETKTSLNVVAREKPEDYTFVNNVTWSSDNFASIKHTMIDIAPYMETIGSQEPLPISATLLDIFIEGFKNKNVLFFLPNAEDGDGDCGNSICVNSYYKYFDEFNNGMAYIFTIIMLEDGCRLEVTVHAGRSDVVAHVWPLVAVG